MKKFIFFILLLIPCFAVSQNIVTNTNGVNYIEVVGKAEQNVAPDQIYLRISLRELDFKNSISLSDIEAKMKTKFQELGIDIKNDLSLVDYVSRYKSGLLTKNVQLTKQYELLIHDTKMLQQVFLALKSLEISNISITKFGTSKSEQYENDLKIKAILNAREKAKMVAEAINQKIGSAIYIQVIEPYDNGLPRTLREYSGAVRNLSSEYVEESEIKSINLTSTILVRFSL